MPEIEQYPVVIVGGGPVGLTTSILLGRLGVTHALFERHPGTSIHPKQVGVNQRSIEIFRSLGVEPDLRAAGAPPSTYQRTAWYTSFGGPTDLHGREIAIRDAWGGGAYADEYAQASPARYTMLAQIRLEPILREHAEASSLAHVFFGAEVTGLTQGADHVDLTVEDQSGTTRTVRAQYLVGADGGRTIANELGIGDTGPTNLVDMASAHFSADLGPYLGDNDCLIYWFVNPDFAGSIGSGFVYQLGPWDSNNVSKEWTFACAFRPDDPKRFDDEAIAARINRSLGLPDLKVDVHSISHWNIRSVVADRFQEGRCFLVGDAAHRIPPWGALGSNTGIQDAHNLAWKLAAALDRPELEPLLDSYEVERRPVALSVAGKSLYNFQSHGGSVDVALGLSPSTPPEEGWAALAERWADTPEGESKRQALQEAMDVLDCEFHAHGAELGFSYAAGALVSQDTHTDEPVPDDILVYHPSTTPGHHVPHAWLETPQGPRSTLDLITPGRFALIVDERSEDWRAALDQVTHPLAELIDLIAVGPGHPVTDPEGRWAELREVDGTGALLVRPDTIVAWRSQTLPEQPAEALESALMMLLAPTAKSYAS